MTSIILSQFFNRNAADRINLKALYEAARDQGNLLPMFPEGETVLVCDRKEATLISREKNGESYDYTREVYPLQKFAGILTAYAHQGQNELGNVAQAYYCGFARKENVQKALEYRQKTEKSISVFRRESGGKFEVSLDFESDTHEMERHILQRISSKERRALAEEAKGALKAAFEEREQLREELPVIIGHETGEKIAYCTAISLALFPHLRN